MELLYYWIDEDKTFKETGFHLSNRFTFKVEFTNKTCNIKIERNPNYLEGFYGNHIINLTALIGQNGSGKTNLLYELISKLSGYQYIFGTGYIKAFYKSGIIYIMETLISNTNINEVRVDTTIEHELNSINDFPNVRGNHPGTPKLPNQTGLVYFNPIYDFRDYPFQIEPREFADVSSTYLLWKDSRNRNLGNYDMVSVHKSQEIMRQFRLTQSTFLQDLDLIEEIRLPNEIQVEVLKTDKVEEKDLFGNTYSLYKIIRNYGHLVWNPHHKEIEQNKHGSKGRSGALKKKAKTWLLINFIDHFFDCLALVKDYDDTWVDVKEEDITFLKHNKIKNYQEWQDWPPISISEYHSMILEFFDKQVFIPKEKFDIVKNINKLFKIIDKYGQVEEENDAVFNFPFEPAFKFLNICDKYAQVFENQYRQGFVRVQWRNLSSGELSFLNLFSRISLGHTQLRDVYDTSDDIPPNVIYLFIDEGEHGMHPHWQKKYIKILIEFLKHFEGVKFQLLITSHSPVMLSDIPKSNVIFLKKNKEETEIVDPETRSETFGSNIHMLFRDSFFVKDGLVGDFAQDKIAKVVKKVNEDSTELDREEFEALLDEIDIIGEPILRTALKEKLSSRANRETSIRYYQQEIEKLRAKNDNDDQTRD